MRERGRGGGPSLLTVPKLWVKFGALKGDDLTLIVTDFDDPSLVIQTVRVDVSAVTPEMAEAVSTERRSTIDELRVAIAVGDAYRQLERLHATGEDIPEAIEVDVTSVTSMPSMWFYKADRGVGQLGN